jgi:hypothetical protein
LVLRALLKERYATWFFPMLFSRISENKSLAVVPIKFSL